jgi:hypothetical protein
MHLHVSPRQQLYLTIVNVHALALGRPTNNIYVEMCLCVGWAVALAPLTNFKQLSNMLAPNMHTQSPNTTVHTTACSAQRAHPSSFQSLQRYHRLCLEGTQHLAVTAAWCDNSAHKRNVGHHGAGRGVDDINDGCLNPSGSACTVAAARRAMKCQIMYMIGRDLTVTQAAPAVNDMVLGSYQSHTEIAL